jgi:hypothetical protein
MQFCHTWVALHVLLQVALVVQYLPGGLLVELAPAVQGQAAPAAPSNPSFSTGAQHTNAPAVPVASAATTASSNSRCCSSTWGPSGWPRSALLPSWHWDMLGDTARNDAYAAALR